MHAENSRDHPQSFLSLAIEGPTTNGLLSSIFEQIHTQRIDASVFPLGHDYT
jgi:hypothetical protein